MYVCVCIYIYIYIYMKHKQTYMSAYIHTVSNLVFANGSSYTGQLFRWMMQGRGLLTFAVSKHVHRPCVCGCV